MIGVDADPVVADVVDQHALRDWPVGHLIGDSWAFKLPSKLPYPVANCPATQFQHPSVFSTLAQKRSSKDGLGGKGVPYFLKRR